MADESGSGGSKLMVYIRIGLRALALFFAIIVMGVISDKLQLNFGVLDVCIFGLTLGRNSGDKNACNYGIAIAVLTVLFVITYIILDILLFLRDMGNAVIKKFVIIGDLVGSAFFALLWIVAFIYLLAKWDDAGPKSLEVVGKSIDDYAPDAGAVIAFSLFSGILWIALAVMAGIRVKSALA